MCLDFHEIPNLLKKSLSWIIQGEPGASEHLFVKRKGERANNRLHSFSSLPMDFVRMLCVYAVCCVFLPVYSPNSKSKDLYSKITPLAHVSRLHSFQSDLLLLSFYSNCIFACVFFSLYLIYCRHSLSGPLFVNLNNHINFHANA